MTTTQTPKTNRPDPLRGNRHAPDGKRFPWGVIDETYVVGPYQIVKYRADRSSYAQESTWVEHGQVRYHPYIDGHDASRCYLSLDAALVGVVAVCNEGPNTQADAYFMRMIGKAED